ncbi:uncharacterized protein YALI1_B11034g [Yarrowia lipolytica]|uniref:Uncharacterized protein n=1 Tax=Yarrowia lipolytica TaxID=4952 RepID=A0A1D8N6Z7_YARLL|nr:hypothetical protein YALI1_B11034g [Yarrowia lipolytica]
MIVVRYEWGNVSVGFTWRNRALLLNKISNDPKFAEQRSTSAVPTSPHNELHCVDSLLPLHTSEVAGCTTIPIALVY